MTEALAWRRWSQNRDTRSRDFLLAHYARLVPWTLKRVTTASMEREDAEAVGRMALYVALDTFDPAKTVFRTWAIMKIKGALREADREYHPVSRRMREQQRLIAAACATRCDPQASNEEAALATGLKAAQVQRSRFIPGFLLSTDAPVAGCDGLVVGDAATGPMMGTVSSIFDDPAVILMRAAEAEAYSRLVDRLRPRVSGMVRDFYYDAMRREEIAEEHGISESRVYQIVRGGVERMKAILDQDEIDTDK